MFCHRNAVLVTLQQPVHKDTFTLGRFVGSLSTASGRVCRSSFVLLLLLLLLLLVLVLVLVLVPSPCLSPSPSPRPSSSPSPSHSL